MPPPAALIAVPAGQAFGALPGQAGIRHALCGYEFFVPDADLAGAS